MIASVKSKRHLVNAPSSTSTQMRNWTTKPVIHRNQGFLADGLRVPLVWFAENVQVSSKQSLGLDETKTAMVCGSCVLIHRLDWQGTNRPTPRGGGLFSTIERSDLTDSLKGVYDIERLASRVSFGKTNPKDLFAAGTTLSSVPRIRAIFRRDGATCFRLISSHNWMESLSWDGFHCSWSSPWLQKVAFIRTDFDETLDKHRRVLREGLVGLLKLRPRSEKTLVLAHLRLCSIIRRWLLFPCDHSATGNVPAHFFPCCWKSGTFGTEELARIEGD